MEFKVGDVVNVRIGNIYYGYREMAESMMLRNWKYFWPCLIYSFNGNIKCSLGIWL